MKTSLEAGESAMKKSKKYSIGVDVGGTKILTSIYDLDAKCIRSRKKEKTPKGADYEEILQIIRNSSDEMRNDLSISEEQIVSMGIAIPGTVNNETGVVGIAPNLNWQEVPLKGKAEEIFPWKITVDNDVNMGLMGELTHSSLQQKSNRLVYGIFCGTGIGGALAIDGKIWNGPGFGAGEIGHIRISGSDDKCGCGQKGCLETKIGKDGIVKFLKENKADSKDSYFYDFFKSKKNRIKSSMIEKALEAGDDPAEKLYKHYVKYLSIGIVTIINTVNPELIILGGGMVEAFGDRFHKDITERVGRTNIMKDKCGTEILLSHFGDDAGIIGAATIAGALS